MGMWWEAEGGDAWKMQGVAASVASRRARREESDADWRIVGCVVEGARVQVGGNGGRERAFVKCSILFRGIDRSRRGGAGEVGAWW